MAKQVLSVVLMVSFFSITGGQCLAGDLLFAKVSRNYDLPGPQGEVHRREFETRMFAHKTWRQRLYYDSSDPDVNETIEIYSRADGSRWLSNRRASPSLSQLIRRRIADGENFDLTKRLNGVRISGCEVALPPELAKEIELLWETMLPGVEDAPVPQTIYTHAPIFIGFAREDHTVKTGSICRAAYRTPIYRAFVDIVTELREACDRGGPSAQAALRKLPSKVRHLSEQLAGR